MRLDENVYVRMRDGVRISLDINRPDDAPVPAILSMSPYGKRTQRFPGGPFSSVESGDTRYLVEHGYAQRWLDYWTKGLDTGIMREPPVTLLIEGSDEWRFEREYPLARTVWTKLYLHTDTPGAAASAPWGVLREQEPASEEPDSFSYPECESRIAADQPVLAYQTEPFLSDVEVIGPASLTLCAAASARDVAFNIKLDDVAPDGSVSSITRGWLRASHRTVDPARSAVAQPFHPHLEAEPLEPGRVYPFEIEIWPLCRNLRAGHRLRLRIANMDSRVHDAGETHAIVDEPMQVTVHHSIESPSYLMLPIIPADPSPLAARPAIDYIPGRARRTQ